MDDFFYHTFTFFVGIFVKKLCLYSWELLPQMYILLELTEAVTVLC